MNLLNLLLFNLFSVPTENTTTTAKTAATTAGAATSFPTQAHTEKTPASSETSRWFKSTPVVIGISVGGFFVLAVLLLIVVILCRRKKQRPKASQQAPSVQGATTGSAFSVNSYKERGITNEIEMENMGVSLDKSKC